MASYFFSLNILGSDFQLGLSRDVRPLSASQEKRKKNFYCKKMNKAELRHDHHSFYFAPDLAFLSLMSAQAKKIFSHFEVAFSECADT